MPKPKSKTQAFSGSVLNVVYSNDDFFILKIRPDVSPVNDPNDPMGLFASTAAPVTVKGDFPGMAMKPGTWFTFEGRWINHPQYGKQLQSVRSPVSLNNWTNERVKGALTSRGVGPSMRYAVERHARQLGKTMFEVLEAEDLDGAPGMDEVAAAHVLTNWKSLRTYIDGAAFLIRAGLNARAIGRIRKKFGGDLQEILTRNPWVITQVPGITFKEADALAQGMGVGLDHPGRLQGAVLSAVKDVVREGNVYCSVVGAVNRVTRLVPSGQPPARKIAEAIGALVKSGQLIVDRDTDPGNKLLYDAWHYKVEVGSAEALALKLKRPLEEDELLDMLAMSSGHVETALVRFGRTLDVAARSALQSWASAKKVNLTQDQMKAATLALISPVSLLTGLPGTGKTTTLKAIVSVARDAGIPLLLVAPTGIAAKRMASVTGVEAHTVHRAFGAKGFRKDQEDREATYVGVTGSSEGRDPNARGSQEWGYGPDNPHPAKLVIVDESSMLDLYMLYRLVISTREDCRFLFVGDPYQLPSVGSGDVLRDMVKSGVFPHTHLDKIFRQADTSGIVLAAHAVHAGKFPQIDQKDFVLKEAPDETDASDQVVALARTLYHQRANFQILSPRHGGDSGVTVLNHRLRQALNPQVSGLVEVRLGNDVIREGDRVMVIKNDYDNRVYNGDVGKVSRIDKRAKEIEVKVFEGPGVPDRVIRYKYSDAVKVLRLAYAQTVHKSQGQEYDVIVLPVLDAFGRQLQRNLFYTAITRAKKRVYLVGTRSAVMKAIRNNKAQERSSGLSMRLANLV